MNLDMPFTTPSIYRHVQIQNLLLIFDNFWQFLTIFDRRCRPRISCTEPSSLSGLGSLALPKAAPSQKKCGRAPQAPDCAACGEEKRRRRKKEEEEFLSASSDSWLLLLVIMLVLPRDMDQWIGVRFLNPERCMNVFSRALLNDSHAILVGSYFRRCTCSSISCNFSWVILS